MSTMNILSATLILLILCVGAALFFGMRSASAAEATPLFAPPTAQPVFAPDAMDDRSAAL
jgi:hypothetical protein